MIILPYNNVFQFFKKILNFFGVVLSYHSKFSIKFDLLNVFQDCFIKYSRKFKYSHPNTI